MKVSIIIPAHNEEETVGFSVKSVPMERLNRMGLETEIIVVNNASTDRTAEEALKYGARVVYEGNLGYGNAYLRGFEDADGDIIVIADADGSHPLEKIPEFIKPILEENVDFVMCSRVNGNGFDNEAIPPLHRHVGNPLLTSTLNFLFDSKFSDTHCGMRAFKREALEKLNLEAPGMEFAIEMIIEAHQKKLTIKEIPVEIRKRQGGETKLRTFRDGWGHLKYMLVKKFSKNNNSRKLGLFSSSIIFIIRVADWV